MTAYRLFDFSEIEKLLKDVKLDFDFSQCEKLVEDVKLGFDFSRCEELLKDVKLDFDLSEYDKLLKRVPPLELSSKKRLGRPNSKKRPPHR